MSDGLHLWHPDLCTCWTCLARRPVRWGTCTTPPLTGTPAEIVTQLLRETTE